MVTGTNHGWVKELLNSTESPAEFENHEFVLEFIYLRLHLVAWEKAHRNRWLGWSRLGIGAVQITSCGGLELLHLVLGLFSSVLIQLLAFSTLGSTLLIEHLHSLGLVPVLNTWITNDFQASYPGTASPRSSFQSLFVFILCDVFIMVLESPIFNSSICFCHSGCTRELSCHFLSSYIPFLWLSQWFPFLLLTH